MKKTKCGLMADASADGDKGQENGRVGAMREVTGGAWARENAEDGGSGAIARKRGAMRIKVDEGMRQLWAYGRRKDRQRGRCGRDHSLTTRKGRRASIVVGVWAEG